MFVSVAVACVALVALIVIFAVTRSRKTVEVKFVTTTAFSNAAFGSASSDSSEAIYASTGSDIGNYATLPAEPIYADIADTASLPAESDV